MRSVIACSLLIVLISCVESGASEEKTEPELSLIIQCMVDTTLYVRPLGEYTAVLDSIRVRKSNLRRRFESTNNDSIRTEVLNQASHMFEDVMIREVFPFWYGTPWDFNGYTNIPNKGKVACGYFVSTTLKHAGLNINRYKLAQQNPLNEARTLALNDSVRMFTATEASSTNLQLNLNLKQGLYFVGLDSHVGFLWHNETGNYFIHSNYYGDSGVTIECVDDSQAFESHNYHIAPLSTNMRFVKSWLLKTEIDVIVK